jgi:hypothetical protein
MVREAVFSLCQKIGGIEKVKVPENQVSTFPAAILPHSRRQISSLSKV